MDHGLQWGGGAKSKPPHHPAENRMDKGLQWGDFSSPKGGEVLSTPPLMVAPEKSAKHQRLANNSNRDPLPNLAILIVVGTGGR